MSESRLRLLWAARVLYNLLFVVFPLIGSEWWRRLFFGLNGMNGCGNRGDEIIYH